MCLTPGLTQPVTLNCETDRLSDDYQIQIHSAYMARYAGVFQCNVPGVTIPSGICSHSHGRETDGFRMECNTKKRTCSRYIQYDDQDPCPTEIYGSGVAFLYVQYECRTGGFVHDT